jgi:hypothetical protein
MRRLTSLATARPHRRHGLDASCGYGPRDRLAGHRVTDRNILPLRVRLFSGRFLGLCAAAFPLLPDPVRTVLAVKGSLRRAQCGRALDRSGPFWNTSYDEGKGGEWNSLRTQCEKVTGEYRGALHYYYYVIN